MKGRRVVSESEYYYIRLRGRVTGPFTFADLRVMIARGKFTRIHEISEDRVNWVSAGTLGELFEARQMAPPPSPAQHSTGETDVSYDATQESAPYVVQGSDDAEGQFYYAQGGVMAGPVDLATLRSFAVDGRLKPDDLVTRAGDDLWLPAAQTEAFASPESMTQSVEPAELGKAQVALSGMTADHRDKRSVPRGSCPSRLPLVSGISGAVLILFSINVPHDRIDGNLRWWWQLFQDSDTAIIALFSVFAVIGSIGLLLVAILLTGRVRGMAFVFCSMAGLLFLMATGMAATGTAAFLFIPVPVLAGCWSLLPTFWLHNKSGDGTKGVVVQGILSGLTLLALIILIFTSTIGLSTITGSAEYALERIAVSVAVGLAGCLCAMICSVMGIFASTGMRTRGAGVIVTSLAVAAGLLLPVSCVMMGHMMSAASSRSPEAIRFILVQMLRFVVTSYALIGLLSVGIWEWLQQGRRGEPRRPLTLSSALEA